MLLGFRSRCTTYNQGRAEKIRLAGPWAKTRTSLGPGLVLGQDLSKSFRRQEEVSEHEAGAPGSYPLDVQVLQGLGDGVEDGAGLALREELLPQDLV